MEKIIKDANKQKVTITDVLKNLLSNLDIMCKKEKKDQTEGGWYTWKN